MEEHSLETQLNRLVEEFGGHCSPCGDKVSETAGNAKPCCSRLRPNVNKLQDSFDYLRICIKYLIFDLEATKRENKSLRKWLEEKG